MKLIAVAHEALARVDVVDRYRVAKALVALRRAGWQVVRVDTANDPMLDVQALLAMTVVYGLKAAIAHAADALAAVGPGSSSWFVGDDESLTEVAIHEAGLWGATTLVVIGADADAKLLDAALLDGRLEAVCALPALTWEGLRMVSGGLGDERALGGVLDEGGL